MLAPGMLRRGEMLGRRVSPHSRLTPGRRCLCLQASRQAPLKEASLLDRIMLSPKQIREKAKAG